MVKEVNVDLGKIGVMQYPDTPAYTSAELAPGYYGPQWYGGIYYPLGFYVVLTLPTNTQPAPWPRLDVITESIIRFNVTYRYRGPGGNYTLYAAVGNNQAGGGEWSGFTESKGIYPAASANWKSITDNIDVKMGRWGAPSHAGEIGAIYFKIEGYKSPAYLNALYVVSAVGEFDNLAITNIQKV